MYAIKLNTLKWVSSIPDIDEESHEGLIRITADALTPNITNLLPENTKFYLSPSTNGVGEDPTIVRTCTSAFFDVANNENIFTFVPVIALPWSSPAYVIVQVSSKLIPYSGYNTVSATGALTVTQINACIADCLANS